MSKTEKLNELFDRWNDGSFDVFMKDGIVCEDSYEDVMFMLKDVNNAVPDDVNDMRLDVQTSTSGGKTWFEVASWTSGLLDGVLPDNITHDMQQKQLKRVAIMNIKKEAGGPKASRKDIMRYAIKDCHNILEEIRICSPKLIVACSRDVFEIFCEEILDIDISETCSKFVFTDKMQDYGRFLDIREYLKAPDPVYLVEYRHPNQCGRQGSREEHFKNMLTIRDEFMSRYLDEVMSKQ